MKEIIIIKRLVTESNIACLVSGSSRQEIVSLKIVKINKNKVINAARNIAARRHGQFMRTTYLIILTLLLFKAYSQNNSNHDLIIKFEVEKGLKNQFWNQVILESEDSIHIYQTGLDNLSATIENIPRGKYMVKIKSIFGDILDTVISIDNKPLYRITFHKTKGYYKPLSDSILLTYNLMPIDSIYIICKVSYPNGYEFKKLQLLKNFDNYDLRIYEDIYSDNYTQIVVDQSAIQKLKWLEFSAKLKKGTNYIEFHFETEIYINVRTNYKLYLIDDYWEEGYKVINDFYIKSGYDIR